MATYILNDLKAFPTAYGGGAATAGGRGKKICIVNTLSENIALTFVPAAGGVEAYYTGGLGPALDSTDVGYIVFDVSGNITLPHPGYGFPGKTVNNKTILGQTAPQGGITITYGSFSFTGSEMIFRHFRSRPVWGRIRQEDDPALGNAGDPIFDPTYDDASTWGLRFKDVENAIVDHMSFSFANDKAVGGYIDAADEELKNLTFSNNFICDSNTNAYTELNAGRPAGTTDKPDNITWAKNIIAYANRTPNIGYNGYGEVYNNIVFDVPFKASTVYWESNLNFIGNHYTEMPSSGSGGLNRLGENAEGGSPNIYSDSNYWRDSADNVLLNGQSGNDEKIIWYELSSLGGSGVPPVPALYFVGTKHTPTVPITYPWITQTPFEAFQDVVTNEDVGAYRYIDDSGNVQTYRDPYDTDRLAEIAVSDNSYVKWQTANWVLPTIPVNTRPGGFWSSVPGIAETFVQAHGISSSTEVITSWTFGADTLINNAGYTAIEMYSFWIAGDLLIPENLYNINLTSLKAFPTAYGGGAIATGGRGLKRGFVTTTNLTTAITYNSGGDYYEGGFQAILQDPNVGYVIFDVSGNIDLGDGGTASDGTWPSSSGIGITNVANKTILGQLAPQGGITLTGGTFRIGSYNNSTGNFIFRYFRSRPIKARGGQDPVTAAATDFAALYGGAGGGVGTMDDAYTWSFLFSGGDNVIVDHCSGSYDYDKIMGGAITNGHPLSGGTMYNYTFSNNLLADGSTGLYASINPDRPNDPEEYVDNISFLRNVLVSLNRTPNIAFDGYGESINNIIHDTPTKNSRIYHDISLNYIGNYFQRTNGTYNWIGPRETIDVPVAYVNKIVYPGAVSTGDGDGYTGPTLNYTGQENEGAGIFLNQARGALADPIHITNTKHTSTIAHQYDDISPQDAFTELITDRDIGANRYVDDSGVPGTYLDPHDTSMLDIVRDDINFTPKQPANWVLPTIPINSRPVGYDSTIRGIANTFVSTHGISTWDEVITNWDFGGYTVTNTAGYNALEMYSFWVAGDFEKLTPGTLPATNNPPSINVIGSRQLTLNVGDTFVDPGVTATDTEDGDLTGSIVTVGSVNTNVKGDYVLSYSVTDSNGNSSGNEIRVISVRSPQIGVYLRGGKTGAGTTTVGYIGNQKLQG